MVSSSNNSSGSLSFNAGLVKYSKYRQNCTDWLFNVTSNNEFTCQYIPLHVIRGAESHNIHPFLPYMSTWDTLEDTECSINVWIGPCGLCHTACAHISCALCGECTCTHVIA